jgi:outer membrane protein assembly factor BamB
MKRVFTAVCFSFCLWGCNFFTAPKDDDSNKHDEKMKLLWEIPYEPVGVGINATPLLIGDSLVIMSAGRENLAIQQGTGKVRWRNQLAEQTDIQTNEFKTDGVRVFATHVEDVRAYNLFDGSLAWIILMPEERGHSFPERWIIMMQKSLSRDAERFTA